MDIYKTQRQFFEESYRNGVTPWDIGTFSPEISYLFGLIEQRLSDSSSVLDIGCGEGRNARFFHEKGIFTVGVDYLFTALKDAIRKSHPKGLHYINGDLFSLPFKEGVFDIVVDYGLFHHIRRRDERLYLDILRYLTKRRSFFMLCCFTRGFAKSSEGSNKNWLIHKGHYDRFSSRDEIISLFKKDYSPLAVIETLQTENEFFYLLFEKR